MLGKISSFDKYLLNTYITLVAVLDIATLNNTMF